jgi:hypothetical protein
MTNNAFAHITPADVEFVPVTSIIAGDVLVNNFHTKRQHADEAPTARQLTRATFVRVDTISTNDRIVDINSSDDANRVTVLATVNVWRVTR